MGTTKEQRAAASAIIEKFAANDVTFPTDFVLALLGDANERDRLAERVREFEEERSILRNRLEISPYGEDRIDELSMAVDLARHRAETAEAKLAVAVEALEYCVSARNIIMTSARAGGALSKIKGAP